MSMEPINVFSHRIDPKGVASLLRSMSANVQVVGPDDEWERIVVSGPKRFLRRAATLTFLHTPEYYDGPKWPMQKMGMQNYFAGFPDGPLKADVLRLIGSFRFALATEFSPDVTDYDNDERLGFLYAVAKRLDGALFTPSALRDAQGRVLLSADGEVDAGAVLPKIPETLPDVTDGDDADDGESDPVPPTAERVARRALALAAVTGRALLEQEDPTDAMVRAKHQSLLLWIDEIGIGDELEPNEWSVVQRPPGRLDERALVDSTWRLEGLVVLAWALDRFEIPAADELVAPDELLRSVGFLDVDAARDLLAQPSLRTGDERERMHRILLGLHWRLRNYSLRPQAMDFRAFSQNCWFGSFDASGIRMIGDDLAIGKHPIAKAPADLVGRTHSAAMERHLAINWLGGSSVVYSETDTST